MAPWRGLRPRGCAARPPAHRRSAPSRALRAGARAPAPVPPWVGARSPPLPRGDDRKAEKVVPARPPVASRNSPVTLVMPRLLPRASRDSASAASQLPEVACRDITDPVTVRCARARRCSPHSPPRGAERPRGDCSGGGVARMCAAVTPEASPPHEPHPPTRAGRVDTSGGGVHGTRGCVDTRPAYRTIRPACVTRCSRRRHTHRAVAS